LPFFIQLSILHCGDAGTFGTLFPIDDHQALCREITRFVKDDALRNSVADAAFEKWKTGFSKSAIVDQYLRFLQTL